MQPGKILELSDFFSLAENLKEKYAPQRHTISRVTSIDHELGELKLLETDGPLLSVLNVDGKKQFLVLNRDQRFEQLNRKQAVDEEMFWLFQTPTKDGWEVTDLVITDNINDDDKGLKYLREYSIAAPCRETPHRSGMDDLFGAFVQYHTEDLTKINSFMAIIEIGNILSTVGGVMTLYNGYAIEERDIKFI